MVTASLANGGQLQMLKVVGRRPTRISRPTRPIGASYPIEWVNIADPARVPRHIRLPAPTTNDQALTAVGNQGRALGAAGFSRLEGQVFDRGVVYFTSTQGGGAAETGPELIAGYGNGTGQVWAYRPADQTLTCVFQSPSNAVARLPRQRHAPATAGP